MSRIVILGITGRVGSRLAAELLTRGHTVTGIARNVSTLPSRPGLSLHSADATRAEALAPLLRGHDAVISTTRFVGGSEAGVLIAAARQADVPRLLVVGGAGSLEVAPGVALVDTPEFPTAYKAEASAGRDFLRTLQKEKDLDWTFLSPAALIEPEAPRTGRYRLGADNPVVDTATGTSHVALADLAVAIVDEAEQRRHVRQRFTVGV